MKDKFRFQFIPKLDELFIETLKNPLKPSLNFNSNLNSIISNFEVSFTHLKNLILDLLLAKGGI